MLKSTQKVTLLILGHLCVVLGIIGAFLPIMPTTPFLILACWFYSKSSPRFKAYLLSNKYFGPTLIEWEKNGVIKFPIKILATTSIIALFGLSLYFFVQAYWARILMCTIGALILGFIWSRPSAIEKKNET